MSDTTHGNREETLLDRRVQAAYAAMGPSDEATERVLANLRARQSAGHATRRNANVLRFAVPLAIAASVAGIVVALRPATQMQTVAKSTTVEFNEQDTKAIEVADEAAESAESAVMAEEAPALYELYPYVELSDGKRMTVGPKTTDEVDASLAEDAVATDQAHERSVPCQVVQDRYLRYEGDVVWYELKKS